MGKEVKVKKTPQLKKAKDPIEKSQKDAHVEQTPKAADAHVASSGKAGMEKDREGEKESEEEKRLRRKMERTKRKNRVKREKIKDLSESTFDYVVKELTRVQVPQDLPSAYLKRAFNETLSQAKVRPVVVAHRASPRRSFHRYTMESAAVAKAAKLAKKAANNAEKKEENDSEEEEKEDGVQPMVTSENDEPSSSSTTEASEKPLISAPIHLGIPHNDTLRSIIFLNSEMSFTPKEHDLLLRKILSFRYADHFGKSFEEDVETMKVMISQFGFSAGSSAPAILFSMKAALACLLPHFEKLVSSKSKTSYSFVDIAELLGGLLVSFHTRWTSEIGKATAKCTQAYYKLLPELVALYLNASFNADWSDRSLGAEAATKVIDFSEIQLFFAGSNSGELMLEALDQLNWGFLLAKKKTVAKQFIATTKVVLKMVSHGSKTLPTLSNNNQKNLFIGGARSIVGGLLLAKLTAQAKQEKELLQAIVQLKQSPQALAFLPHNAQLLSAEATLATLENLQTLKDTPKESQPTKNTAVKTK